MSPKGRPGRPLALAAGFVAMALAVLLLLLPNLPMRWGLTLDGVMIASLAVMFVATRWRGR